MIILPLVIYDYNKCTGDGSCAEVCPVKILEKSENKKWCKPKDHEVKNRDAVNKFHEEVEDEENPVDIKIKNNMPECVECLSCEASCPQEAIKIEPS